MCQCVFSIHTVCYHTQFPSLFIISVIIKHLKQRVINEHRLVMQIQRRCLKKIFCPPFLTPFLSFVSHVDDDGSVQAHFSIQICFLIHKLF